LYWHVLEERKRFFAAERWRAVAFSRSDESREMDIQEQLSADQKKAMKAGDKPP
jgi:DUF1365 family protein